MSEDIVLIGGSGHAKVIIDCIRASGKQVLGILDDGIDTGTEISGVKVLGKSSEFVKFTTNPFIIAIGNNTVRKRFAENMDVHWETVVHPSAIISDYAHIGEGSVIMPSAVINSGAVIGKHCIINSGAIVEHDNVLGDYVHISPNAALGGTVVIDDLTHIGIGACVRNNIRICQSCTIGAGAAVVKNITESGIYVGVPARRKVPFNDDNKIRG